MGSQGYEEHFEQGLDKELQGQRVTAKNLQLVEHSIQDQGLPSERIEFHRSNHVLGIGAILVGKTM